MRKKYATTIPKLGRARRQKVRKLREARGIPAKVDSAPITAHIVWLHSIGFSSYALAAAAGLPPHTVNLVRSGAYQQTRIDHAARLRALTHIPVEAQHGTRVAAVGVVRRLQALRATGFTLADIAAELDCTAEAVRHWTKGTQVRQETWQKIADLYERLSGSVGASEATRRRGQQAGWLLPFEWDGYDIDDPRVTPPRAIRSGRQPRDEEAGQRHRDEVERLTALGFSAPEIADRLGVSPRQITRYRADIKQKGTAA